MPSLAEELSSFFPWNGICRASVLFCRSQSTHASMNFDVVVIGSQDLVMHPTIANSVHHQAWWPVFPPYRMPNLTTTPLSQSVLNFWGWGTKLKRSIVEVWCSLWNGFYHNTIYLWGNRRWAPFPSQTQITTNILSRLTHIKVPSVAGL